MPDNLSSIYQRNKLFQLTTSLVLTNKKQVIIVIILIIPVL